MQVFKKDPIESKTVKSFYEVPGEDKLLVNRQGQVYDLVRQVVVPKTCNPTENKYVYVGKHSVHMLVAETFLSKEHLDETNKIVVNHIDGNKSNNCVENLEWVSYQENSIHAYSSGLRQDNIPIEIRDPLTGKVQGFYSYWDCARELGTNGANIWYYINRTNRNRLFKNQYEIRLVSQEWENIDLEKALLHAYLESQPIFLFNKVTGRRFIFDNKYECSKLIRCKYQRMIKLLIDLYKTGEISVDINEWTVMFLANAKEWVTEQTEYVKKKERKDLNRGTRIPARIRVETIKTGEITEYPSLQVFTDMLGIRKDSAEKHIWRTKGWLHGKYRIEYLDT